MVSDENIIEVDYSEDKTSEKTIRGKVLYYSTSQVAQTLGETDSKIRYYTNVFDDILKIEISNKQRRYTDTDINKLKFIIELKNEGMTIKQIQEYCAEVDINDGGDIQIKESNPLTIQAMAKALLEEQQKQMDVFKEDLIDKLKDHMQIQISMMDRSNESIKEQIALTVDDIVTEKIEAFKEEYESKRQEEMELRQRELDMYNDLRNRLDNKKQESESKQGFFSRMIGRK